MKRTLDEESQHHNLYVYPMKRNINRTTNGSYPDYMPETVLPTSHTLFPNYSMKQRFFVEIPL